MANAAIDWRLHRGHSPSHGQPPSDPVTPAGMVRQTHRAFGVRLSVLLPKGRGDLAAAVWGTFAEWEATAAATRPDSELAYLHTRSGETLRVSELLYRIIEHALWAAEATHGWFDPTHDAVPAGLFSRAHSFGDAHTRSARRRAIRLDPVKRRVTLPRGVALDLDEIARAMAVDASLELLAALGVEDALLAAGAALAVRGTLPNGEGFPVAVGARTATCTIRLSEGGLATVGSNGIDPLGEPLAFAVAAGDTRTRRPTPRVQAATAVAATCERAAVAARVAQALGPAAGNRWLTRHGLAGCFALADGRIFGSTRWPTDAVRPESFPSS